MNSNNSTCYFIDAHVHLYDCFPLSIALDCAQRNFIAAAHRLGVTSNYMGILMLTETANNNVFKQIQEYADSGVTNSNINAPGWLFNNKANDKKIVVAKNENGDSLMMIAGRQVITKEGLEILVLITSDEIIDGKPAKELIEEVNETNGLVVFPWGVGKWLGKRGKILADLMTSNLSSKFLLGDNGGRPSLWLNPSHFSYAQKLGMKIIPGSDPLPMSSEVSRIGSFGFSLNGISPAEFTTEYIKGQIKSPDSRLRRYGDLESNFRFIYNQTKLRLQ